MKCRKHNKMMTLDHTVGEWFCSNCLKEEIQELKKEVAADKEAEARELRKAIATGDFGWIDEVEESNMIMNDLFEEIARK